MKEMKLCSISDKYIDFLREDFPNVYSNKETRRTHTRKWLNEEAIAMGINLSQVLQEALMLKLKVR